jgi:hypothetical protein
VDRTEHGPAAWRCSLFISKPVADLFEELVGLVQLVVDEHDTAAPVYANSTYQLDPSMMFAAPFPKTYGKSHVESVLMEQDAKPGHAASLPGILGMSTREVVEAFEAKP